LGARAKDALDKASSVQGFVLHDLRRTAASLMAAPPVSAPPQMVERILNHVTGSRTALQHLYNRYRYDDAEIADVFTKYHALSGLRGVHLDLNGASVIFGPFIGVGLTSWNARTQPQVAAGPFH
jgi:hypothetical protein